MPIIKMGRVSEAKKQRKKKKGTQQPQKKTSSTHCSFSLSLSHSLILSLSLSFSLHFILSLSFPKQSFPTYFGLSLVNWFGLTLLFKSFDHFCIFDQTA
jgi:hypothetical protein